MTGPRDQTLSARARIQRTGEAYKSETCLQLAKYLVKLLAAYSYNYKYDKILISSFTGNLCGFFGVGKRNPKWMGFLSTDGRSVG